MLDAERSFVIEPGRLKTQDLDLRPDGPLGPHRRRSNWAGVHQGKIHLQYYNRVSNKIRSTLIFFIGSTSFIIKNHFK